MTRAAKAKQFFGKGSYTVPEAAKLLRLPTPRVRRWAAGYSFRADGAVRFSDPLIEREFEDSSGLVELSFLDLVELLFIDRFHSQGVSLPVIRQTAKYATSLFGTDHPFCVRRLRTDGITIFAEMHRAELAAREQAGKSTIDLRSGQHVFDEVVSPFLRRFTYDVETDLVKEWFPLGQERGVVLNPALSFGQPVIAKSGVPTRALKAAADAGTSFETIADWYELSVSAVHDAVEFENGLRAA